MRKWLALAITVCITIPANTQDIQTYSESRIEYDRLISRIEYARLMSALLEAEALPYPPQHIIVDDWDFLSALPEADVIHPPIDPYGGVMPLPEGAQVVGTPGFFRTAKVDGTWWFVTPDDNLFLSIAVTDVTHHGHSLDGNNPYAEAVTKKYGDFDSWAEPTLERIRGWGFNSLGPWSSSELYARGIPYTVIVDVAAHLGYADSENYVPDYFADDFEAKADAHIARVVAPYRDDPWLLGFFTDNEAVWGPDWRTSRTLVQIYWSMPEDSAGRREVMRFVREQSETLDHFNETWGLALSSWDDLDGLTPEDLRVETSDAIAVSDAFTAHVMDRYASVCRKLLDRHAPNHLILGCRFHDYLGDAIKLAAARHFDVISLACYWMMPPTDRIGRIAEEADRPFLIEEFSFRGMDTELPNENFAGPNVPSQYDRAIAYHHFVREFMRHPWAISVHWYKYFDNPLNAPDFGENYGLVDSHDEPYDILVKMVEAVNSRLYALRLPSTR